MSSRWSAITGKIIAVGSFIGWLVSMLIFFGLDAKTIGKVWQAMSAHYIFAVVAVAFFLIFVAALYYLWDSSRITPENVQPRVRQWLDAFSLGNRWISDVQQRAHFGYEVTLVTGIPISVFRTISHPHYLTLVCVIEISPDHRNAYQRLSEAEQHRFIRKVRLEAAKAKIAYQPDDTWSKLAIERRIPITSNLTEAYLLDSLGEVNFAALVMIETIGSLLEDSRPPSSTPDRSASPP